MNVLPILTILQVTSFNHNHRLVLTLAVFLNRNQYIEKHFLSSEEQKNYLALLKEIEEEYNIGCKRLFFSKQIDENRNKAKNFLSEKAKMLSPENGEYEFYSTSYRIKITERGMNEKLGNIEQST